MKPNRILIVDDDVGVRFGIRDYLESHGFELDEAATCDEAMQAIDRFQPDAVILDHRLPDGTALDMLAQLQQTETHVPVVILTAYGSIELAVDAIKLGATQFLTKPVDLATLLVILCRVLETERSRRKERAYSIRDARTALNPFVGTSAAIRLLAVEAERVASSESPMLILGETGTGKSVLARWIHEHSARAKEAFVDINCAGLTRDFLETELFGHQKGAFTGAVTTKPGLFEVAHTGTLFLDEIGDMDAEVQPKLLKVIEEKRFRRLGDVRERVVNVWLIAATHRDLTALAAQNKFRRDLYYRINTFRLTVPGNVKRTSHCSLAICSPGGVRSAGSGCLISMKAPSGRYWSIAGPAIFGSYAMCSSGRRCSAMASSCAAATCASTES